MNRLRLSALVLCLTLSACDLFSPTSPLSEQCYTNPQPTRPTAQLVLGRADSYVPGRLLVAYREPVGEVGVRAVGVQTERKGVQGAATGADLRVVARAVRERFDLRSLEVLETAGRTELVRTAAGTDVTALAERLRRDPRVRYAEPDYYLYPLAAPDPGLPNDPQLGEQWHLRGFGVPEAWGLETGEANITLAVLDSGVDLAHEDLTGRAYRGCDVYSGDNDPSPGAPSTVGTEQRHGTHVAGIALASGDNGKGVAGVAYTGVKLLPVKVFDDAGRDPQRTATSVVARAIRWAAGLSVEGMNRNPHKAHIINLSLGGKANTPDGTIQTLNEAVQDARDAGVLVVAAAGNESVPGALYAPASAPGALAVGSVDTDYRRSAFSNYNPSGRTVDLMAPGGSGENSCGGVYSTLSPAFDGDADAYGCEQGTSMAAPFVAGVAALIWSQHPDWTDDRVAERLLASTRLTGEMNRAEYGAGVVCADRALGAATLCGE